MNNFVRWTSDQKQDIKKIFSSKAHAHKIAEGKNECHVTARISRSVPGCNEKNSIACGIVLPERHIQNNVVKTLSEKCNWTDVLWNNWPVIFKSVKVMKIMKDWETVPKIKETQQVNALWDPVQSRNYKRRLVEKLMSVSIRILGWYTH